MLFALNEMADLRNGNAVTHCVVEAGELRTQGKNCYHCYERYSYEDETVFHQALSRLARPRAPEQVARWPDHVVSQSALAGSLCIRCLDVEYVAFANR